MTPVHRFGCCLVAIVSVAALPITSRAQGADTLSGRVTTDSGVAISGAEIIATRAPDRAFKSTLSDKNGDYQIVFEQGTGDYLIHAAAIGREADRVRLKRAGGATTLSHDFHLKSSVQQLATVTVSAQKEKPERDRDLQTEAGESGKRTDGVAAAIAPDARGNIDAAAATVPGVAMTPNGISVLGLDPSQNTTTLNGMGFSGADVPRNAQTYTHVSASTYDPSRGWFSGAQVNVELSPGGLYVFRPASITIDAPLLQYADRTSSALGQKFSNVIAGIGSQGAFLLDKMNYNYAVQGSHRTSPYVSLEDASPDLLQHSGVARDSVTRLLGILSAAGIPFAAQDRSGRTSDNVSFIGRIDHSRYSGTTGIDEKQTWGLVGYAKLGRSSALGVGPTTPTMHGGDNSQQIYSVQGVFSSYLHDNDYLTEARTAFTIKRDRSSPYLRIPNGTVLLTSQFPDAPDAVTSLAFGGNSSLSQDSREWTWETNSLTRFYTSRRTHHRVQLTADSRIDGFSQATPWNTNGTFSFSSLADLTANTPSSFTRTLNAPMSSAKEWNAFASLGDYWRRSSTLQVLYGARLEANRFLDRPDNNPDVERIFGARTDNVPRGFHASPRIGFTWIRVEAGEGVRFSQLGMFNLSNPSYVRGGIGEFRSMLPADLLSQAMVATGLPGGASYLTCIGGATPAPDWVGYGADPTTIPRQCANGAGVPTPFADAAPAIQLFDRSYVPPRSWRGNLSYASMLGPLTYSVEGIYSLNLNQPGTNDLNFSNVPRFATADDNRPVFVSSGSIVQSTGLLSAVEARKSSLFGPVLARRSDLRSISRQATIIASPKLEFVSAWFLSVAYTLSSVRALASGFDAPTFDSPLEREWGRGNLDARHQFLVQAGKTIKRVTFTLFGHIQSGLPFTPIVGGDVNGDGLANDRAFIFDPAAAGSALGAGLRALAASSSARTRDCLSRQIGHPAGRNSCEGPWTATLNGQIGTQFEIPHSLGRWVTVSLGVANPLGGLDQLLHGSSRLRGWGLPAFPDPVLYNVRGFDSATNRFRYEVNPRFGNTQPANSIIRAPFRLTLDVSMNVGPAPQMQQLERWIGAGRGKRPGPRLTAEELKKKYSRNVPNPYSDILEESDSLLLTASQERAIDSVQKDYLHGVDSLWTPLTEYLAALGDTFDPKDAVNRQEAVTDAAWEFSRLHVQRSLGTILSPVQLKLLPWEAGLLYTAKKPLRVRMFSG